MTSLFKKTVLTVAMLGCVFGAQAEKKAVSRGEALLASAAMVAGSAVTVVGAMGFGSMQTNLNDLPPSLAEKLAATGPYALIAIPGAILTLSSAIYCFKAAKGFWKKSRSTVGSLLTIAGGLVLAGACVAYVGANTAHTMATTTNWRDAGAVIKDAAWYGSRGSSGISAQDASDAAMASGAAALGGALISFVGYAIQPVDNSSEESKA